MRGRELFRLLRIFRILRAHGLHEIVHALRPKLPSAKPKIHTPYVASPDLGKRLREALEHLGPIFVKFGQALSTRPDLLPPEIARELAKLQDDVPPFPNAEAIAVVEQAYGKRLHDVFREFVTEPLASASIAQVHSATLNDGTAVVVKILRPNVEVQIERDLEVLRTLAELAHRFWPESRRLRPRDVVKEYSKTIVDELDFMREAANASQLRRNWEHSPILKVPEVYWDYCHPKVMVMEQVFGIPISDVGQLNAHNVNMKLLAERGVEIFFTQVFKHNFFHADMHPGNIFVDVSDPEDPNYVSVDFGIVGTLDPGDQHYLAANLLAFFHRDYRKVAQLHVDSQWVPVGTRVDEFESAIRTVCEPIFNKPLKDISFGQFLVRLFSTARRFQMEVQPQLVLLQKTLLNIEGLGRQLYPDLDLWDTAKPFLEDWMKEKMSGKELWSRLQDQLPEISGNIHEAPLLLMRALHQIADGTLRIGTDPQLEHERREAQHDVARKRRHAIIGGSLLITTALLAGQSFQPVWVTAAVGIAAVIWMFRSR